VENHQYDSRGGSIQHLPVDTLRVGALRERVLKLVSALADRGQEGIALNAIKVLGDGIRRPKVPGFKNDDSLQKDWIPLRWEALNRLAAVAERYQSAFIHWAIWGELWWPFRHELTELLRAECWRLFGMLEDTFELRLVRATCSSGEYEITSLHTASSPPSRAEQAEHAGEVSRERWNQLCEQSAQELVECYRDAPQLHGFLVDFVRRGTQLGFLPQLGNVLRPLTATAPVLANALAHEILASPRLETQHAFSSLVDGLSPHGTPVRLDLVEAAALSVNQPLQVGASRLLIGWHRQQRLPNAGELLLLQMVASGSAELLRAVLLEAEFLPAQSESFARRILSSVLENPTSEDITEPLLAMLERLERSNSPVLPSNLVASLFNRLVPVPRFNGSLVQSLDHLAETRPKEVFTFYRERVDYSRGRPTLDLFDSETYEALPGHGDPVSLRCFAAMDEFAAEFAKLRDELISEQRNQSIAEDSGYHRQLRQLARWMLEESGRRYTELVSAWISLIETRDDLDVFLTVVVAESPTLVHRNPTVLDRLLRHLEKRMPQHLVKTREDLMFSASRWIGASRYPQGREIGDDTLAEEQEPWHIIPQVEKQISNCIHLPLLRGFYEELLKQCQAILADHKHPNRAAWPRDEDD